MTTSKNNETDSENISKELQKIKELLDAERIGNRKQGIELAAKRAGAEAGEREILVSWLKNLGESDPVLNVRDHAKAALVRHGLAKPCGVASAEDRHFFEVTCPNGHTGKFDRREVCGGKPRTIYRKAELQAASLDDIWLVCPVCHDEMYVSVDCEGYR